MTTNVQSAEQKSWAETPPNSPTIRHAIGEIVENQTWLDKLASPIQNSLLAFFGQPGQPGRKLKDILNGTWLVAAQFGVGQMMAVAGATFQSAKVFMGLFIIAGAGMAMTFTLQWLESRFEAWRPRPN